MSELSPCVGNDQPSQSSEKSYTWYLLEKAYDRYQMSGWLTWWTEEKVSRTSTKIIRDMYEGPKTSLRKVCGMTSKFTVGVGLQ